MLQKLNSNISNNIQANEHLQWFKSGVEEARKQDVKLLAMQFSVITQEDSWVELFNCRDTMLTHHIHVFTVYGRQTTGHDVARAVPLYRMRHICLQSYY